MRLNCQGMFTCGKSGKPGSKFWSTVWPRKVNAIARSLLAGVSVPAKVLAKLIDPLPTWP